ncbi:hypothetical protein FRC17_000094 [Serendipita sp. 399]|nr:hypothetical protein FRC17_000094 [Serendipita sp. 399]
MRAIFRKNKKKKSPAEETVAKSLPVLPSGASTSTTGTSKTTINRASSPTAHNEASEGVEQFLGIIKDISEATEILSPLKSACALVIRGIQTVRTLQNNQTAWTELCEDLEGNLALMRQHESELEEKPTIDDNTCKRALEHYIRVTVGVVELASRRSSTTDRGPLSTTTRIGTIITETEEIGRCREMIETAWQSYTLAMRRLIVLKVKDIESQLKAQERDQDEAKRTQLDESRANFTSAYGDRLELCEEGTRLHILNAIQGWATDSETSKQIFWLCDAAGTGKSTIAATMAKEWSRDNSLAGRFFFSPNSITTQTTKEFCLTVARDIITNQTDLADIVQDAIDVTPVDRQAWLEVQLRLLIIDPLRHANGNRSLLLVIDALDNCVLEEERIGLLNGLIRYLPSIYHLKVLLTSRPMPDITNILATSPLVQSSEIQLLNVRQSYHHDINIYVEKRLGNISIVSSDQRKMIITMSGGLFLFAATVCRMLERDRHRTDILGILSNVGTTEKLERRMDILYLSALKQALVDKSANELMMSVLSLIIIAYQPLSINTLRKFLPNNAYVNDFVEDLGSVLKDGDPDRPIKVLHPTFREFVLSNEERANGFVVNSTMSSAAMAIACIDSLEHCLSEDIFHLDQAGRLSVLNIDVIDLERIINTHTTAAERYASAFWAHHVAVAELIPELRSRVVKFLSHKLLNWVELMSWRGSIETCVEGLSRLNGRFSKMALPSGSQIAESESSIIRHARQFVAQHQTLITESALQVYSVALFFTPQNPFFNQLKHRYSERLPRITTEYVSKWGNHVTIGGHSSRGYGESIYSLEFSPTGSRLISVGLDGLMFLWNGETGGLVGNPYQEPLGGGRPLPRIKNLRFSTDGTRFAFDILGNSKLHIYFSLNGHLVTPSVKQERPYCLSSTMSHIFLVIGSSLQRQTISRRGEPSLTEHIGDLPKDFETKRVLISPNSQYSLCIGDSKAAPDVVKLLLWELDPFKQVSNYQLPIDITKDLRYYLSTVNAIFSHDSSRCVVWTDTLLQILNCHTGEKLLETLDKEALHAYIVISPWSRLLACFTETVMMGSIAVRDLENGYVLFICRFRQMASGSPPSQRTMYSANGPFLPGTYSGTGIS